MTPVEIAAFCARLDDIRKDYEGRVLPQLEIDASRSLRIPPREAVGKGREYANEAHARTYLINPILSALGWELHTPDNMVVEDPVDPDPEDAAKAHRRFFDYHGRESTVDEGRSLLIVEAKRPRSLLPDYPSYRLPEILAQELGNLATGTKRPPLLPGDWQAWLSSLQDYAKRAKAQYKSAPLRAVITNGEWFVIFLSVEKTLLVSKPEKEFIQVYVDLDDINDKVLYFCPALRYIDISGDIPPQPPEALPQFLNGSRSVNVTLATEISYVRHGQRQPGWGVKVLAIVLTKNNGYVRFQKNYGDDYVVIPHDPQQLEAARETLRRRAHELVAELSRHADLRYLTPTDVENLALRRSNTQDPNVGIKALIINKWDTYLLLSGSYFHLADSQEYDSCPYHAFGECRRTGDAVEPAIYSPSIDPRAFFPSDSPYHCAHRAIHTLRETKCVIAGFEKYLCCRRCALFQRCWPDDGATLPCRAN